ncbi:hypothetical protein H8959_015956 [Pygathrix nigripes]
MAQVDAWKQLQTFFHKHLGGQEGTIPAKLNAAGATSVQTSTRMPVLGTEPHLEGPRPQFPHLYNGYNNNRILLGGINNHASRPGHQASMY